MFKQIHDIDLNILVLRAVLTVSSIIKIEALLSHERIIHYKKNNSHHNTHIKLLWYQFLSLLIVMELTINI